MKSTKDIKVSKKIIDQVIGQDEAVRTIRKAALQRRHVLLIGNPGTGKSMLGLALTELLPKSELKDILAIHNPNDDNNPLIKEMPAGKGRDEVKKYQLDGKQMLKNNNFLLFIVAIFTLIVPWWVRHYYKSDLMFTAFFLGGMLFLAAFAIMMSMGPRMFKMSKIVAPKLIVDNFGKKQAPFFDATGAHAGALLGDCLHDPFQTFFTGQELHLFKSDKLSTNEINKQVDSLMNKHKDKILKKKEGNYEAIYLPKNELSVLGETNDSVSPVEVLSSNRYDYGGEMIKLTTSENKELIVTPEHKVAVWKSGKTTYVKARDIKEGDNVVAKAENIIIDEQDIISTYDKRQQKLAKSYYSYLELRRKNPKWGYKRIATKLGVSYGRTRWWWDNHSAPVPVQTVEWLKKRGLIPLKLDNLKLPLIAKVLGATFGDGGIFENLNAIFLSSSELEATQEFGNDLMTIFGYSIDNNMRTIEGGIEGTSFCYQNTNRNIIRFFKALGAPIGKKTNLEFTVPKWICLSNKFKDEFFGSLIGSEGGIPKVHISGRFVNTLSFGITAKRHLKENRLSFLNEIKNYLEENNINVGKISERKTKNVENFLFRLLISTKFESLTNFVERVKINYCRYKKEKLSKTYQNFKEIKRKRYDELIKRGYGAEYAMKILQLTPQSLYTILNEEKIIP